MNKNDIQVVGMVIETFVGESVYGHNCDFKYEDEEQERYILMLRDSWGRKWELTLWDEYGECGSGWTTASWGNFDLSQVTHFRPFSHVPVNAPLILEGIQIKGSDFVDSDGDVVDDDIDTNVFSVSFDGGDSYYPGGEVSVNTDLFRPLARCMTFRPVYIFTGASALGKSTLATFISRGSGWVIYETDSNQELPDSITADVVVIGGKYNHTIEDVKARLFGSPDVIVVNFSKEED